MHSDGQQPCCRGRCVSPVDRHIACRGRIDRIAGTSWPALTYEHWAGLPFMAQQAADRGYELPLPLGVSLIYNYLERDIEITDVRVGVGDGPLVSVNDYASLGSRPEVHVVAARFDAWLLPFLNLYMLGGHIWNNSKTQVTVKQGAFFPGSTIPPLPAVPREDINVELETDLEGAFGGVGMTLAAGYDDFFMNVDANWTASDMGFADDFIAIIASARAGWHGTSIGLPLRSWTGLAYWDTENTASASADLDGDGTIDFRFEADQGPKRPINMIFGGNYGYHRHSDVFVEVGTNYGDMFFLALGISGRI